MMNTTKRRFALIALTVAAVLVGGGIAVAYWTNTGSGSGSGDTGSNVAVVVNQTSTFTGLAPGLPAQTLSGNFDNPNAGPVYVTAVTATVTGTDKIGCNASDYTIAGTAPVGVQVPAGNGVGAWTGLTIQFNNKTSTNQDVCKNAVVTVAYASS
jgi:hypothetical protein